MDLRTCDAVVWRATRPVTNDLNGTLALALEQLQAQGTKCVALATDFTVYDHHNGGGMTCADVDNSNMVHCRRLVEWRPYFLDSLRRFKPIVLADFPLVFHEAVETLHLDPETLAAALDLAMLVQVTVCIA